MVEEEATRTQQAPCLFKVFLQSSFTHMLEHAHADQLVVTLRFVDPPVISDLYPTAVSQAGLTDAFVCQISLGLAEGDTERLHTVVACGMDNQSAPATADVQ